MEEEQVTMIEEGSGNVFADLGYPNADEHLVKARLVHAISQAINDRRLSQSEAAALIGLDQPKVSKLLRGSFQGYSSDRLMHILNLLGQDVNITIVPNPAEGNTVGSTSVARAS